MTRQRYYSFDDLTLVEIFRSIAGSFPGEDVRCQYFALEGLDIAESDLPDDNELAGAYIFMRARIKISLTSSPENSNRSLSISFFRAESRVNAAGQLESAPSNEFVEFDVSLAPTVEAWRNDNRLHGVLRILDQGSKPSTSSAARSEAASSISDATRSFSAAGRSALRSISLVLTSLENRRVELEEKSRADEEERRKQFEESIERINEEREALRRQSHMAERRSIASSISAINDTRKAVGFLPKSANQFRWAVFFGALALSALSGYFSAIWLQAAYSFSDAKEIITKLGTAGPEAVLERNVIEAASTAYSVSFWLSTTKSLVGSIVSICALIFAVNWARRSYYDDAGFSREVEQHGLDVARASWVIETLLEVQHEHKGQVPEQWIDAVTRGLFSSQQKNEKDNSASEALAALLSFSAGAKISSNGTEISLGKREVRRIAAESKKELNDD